MIDFEDRTVVEGWNWSARKCRAGNIYAHRGGGPLHAFIAGAGCDHKNGDTLDNRRSNLRRATKAQNCQNRRRASNNTSGFKGVSFRRDRGTWLAAIRPNGKLIKIGTFDSPENAARAYDQAAQQHFGEFAVLNFAAPDYNATADFSGSIDACYDAVRARVATGGPTWEPK